MESRNETTRRDGGLCELELNSVPPLFFFPLFPLPLHQLTQFQPTLLILVIITKAHLVLSQAPLHLNLSTIRMDFFELYHPAQLLILPVLGSWGCASYCINLSYEDESSLRSKERATCNCVEAKRGGDEEY